MKLLIALIMLIALTTTSATVAVFAPPKASLPLNETPQKLTPATATFVNPYFNVRPHDAGLNVPEGGGSATTEIVLLETHLSSSEELFFSGYIDGLSTNEYTLNFVPSSVVLSPDGFASTELTITILGGVRNGTYAVGIYVDGPNPINGGTYMRIIVGSGSLIAPA
jgi:hypothetical protein